MPSSLIAFLKSLFMFYSTDSRWSIKKFIYYNRINDSQLIEIAFRAREMQIIH